MIEPWLTSFPNFFDGKRVTYEFQQGSISDWLTVILPFSEGLREPPVLSYIGRYYLGLGGSVLRIDCRFARETSWLESDYDKQAASMSEAGTNLGHIINKLSQFRFVTFISFSAATLLVHAALQEIQHKDLVQSVWLSPPRRFPWDIELPQKVESLWLAGREDPAFSWDIMREQIGDRLFLADLGHDLQAPGDIMKSVGAAQEIMQKVIQWQGRINAQLGSAFALQTFE